MQQQPRTKCDMCAKVYEDDPLTQHEWLSGEAIVEVRGFESYEVYAFDNDAPEHLCDSICLNRRIHQVVKPEPMTKQGKI